MFSFYPIFDRFYPLFIFILQEAVVTCEEVGKDMDHVEGLQKNYDEFKKVKLFSASILEIL